MTHILPRDVCSPLEMGGTSDAFFRMQCYFLVLGCKARTVMSAGLWIDARLGSISFRVNRHISSGRATTTTSP